MSETSVEFITNTRATLKSCFLQWGQSSFGPRVDFTSTDYFKKELETSKELTFVDGVDYSRACEYAKHEYAELLSVGRAIDSKTEWLFGIVVAAASGLVAFGGLIGLGIAWFVPSLIALLYSMWMALRARLPAKRASTFPASVAVDILSSERMSQSFDGRLAITYGLATCGTCVVHQWRCNQLDYATKGLIAAFALLTISLVANQSLTFVSCFFAAS